MPVKRYVVGTGLTKTLITKVVLSNSPDTEEEELEELNRIFSTDYSFEGQVKNNEEWAIEVLEEAGLPTDNSARVTKIQSRQWYASEIVKMLFLVRAIKERVAAGKGDEAGTLTTMALKLGALMRDAAYTEYWAADTELGIKDRELRRMGAAAAKQARQKRDAFIWALTEDYRKDDKRSAREIAGHIKNRAVRESARSNEPGIDHKLWTSISKLSQDRIRRIVGEKVG